MGRRGVPMLALVLGVSVSAFAGELAQAPIAGVDAAEVIADIQIHGNNATPDADVLAIAAVTRGEPFGPTTLADVRRRLEDSGRFQSAEVRKRFASITDLRQVALVIIVNEHPVSVRAGDPSRGEPAVRILRRRFGGGAMFLPILDVEDGYGVTYGVSVAYTGITSRRSRLVFPLSWGGRKRAGIEFEQPFASGPVGRVRVGAAVERRTNPAFETHDDRRRVWGRAETRPWHQLRGGATATIERVSFEADPETWRSAGADLHLRHAPRPRVSPERCFCVRIENLPARCRHGPTCSEPSRRSRLPGRLPKHRGCRPPAIRLVGSVTSEVLQALAWRLGHGSWFCRRLVCR